MEYLRLEHTITHLETEITELDFELHKTKKELKLGKDMNIKLQNRLQKLVKQNNAAYLFITITHIFYLSILYVKPFILSVIDNTVDTIF